MGVANTLPNYKSFTFDGTNSRACGVYITGRGVFNAPERNVEMVEIPGRNGAYALDKGNFNNIEVTYPAGIFADTEADFAQAVSDLRNFLCSKSGYCRLEDDYNSGEYRMAIYKSGLEVDHDMLTAGEFNIVFECKPQRWLTSGETAVSVASGGKVTNPTLFDAKPQLQVYGYGNIDMGGTEISIANVPIGNVQIAPAIQSGQGLSHTITINTNVLNSGDTFTVSDAYILVTYKAASSYYTYSIDSLGTTTNCTSDYHYNSGVKVFPDTQIFSYGTSGSLSFSAQYSVGVRYNYGAPTYTTVTVSGTISYDGNDAITISATKTNVSHTSSTGSVTTTDIYANSTMSALGNPMYIDLDIGEAYNLDNGSAVSVNDAVQIPAELPVLPPGDTTFTYDNTITQFKVLPRWWKV